VKVSVKTTASNPEYQWYFNDAVIPNAIGSDYEVTKEGNYKVVVKQTSGCVVSEELSFQIINDVVPQVVNIPNLISPNGDGINDTWIVPQEYASGSNAEILLINSSGELILKTNNYQNNWPENMTVFKNVYPVYYYIITTQDRKVRKGSITVLK
jgi:gliding motility-associated-like protein